MKPIRRPGPEARAWLSAESALQRRRCRALAVAGAAHARRRAGWSAAFLARLATRAGEATAAERRRMPPGELPVAPRRRPRGAR